MNKTEHLLTCLAEECAEVQQAVAKALRFGLDDGYPGTDRTNEGDLLNELNDLFAVVEMLHDVGIWWRIDSAKVAEKKAKVERFMEYAEERGTLVSNVEFDTDSQRRIDMIMKRKQPIYSFTTKDKVDAELPQCIKDAMNKSGWNAFGIYELVNTVLTKERAQARSTKGSNA